MGAFEILKLVGASVAIIVAAIVFLVIFFRGMAWMDGWVKKRTSTDLSPEPSRRSQRGLATQKKQRNASLNLKRSGRASSTNDLPMASLPERSRQVARESIAKQRQRHQQSKNTTTAIPTGLRSSQSLSSNPSIPIEDRLPSESRRLVSILLVSGESIEDATLLTKPEADQLIAEIGFSGDSILVARKQNGDTFLIRNENVRLITMDGSGRSLAEATESINGFHAKPVGQS
jgi:hypothetical protein